MNRRAYDFEIDLSDDNTIRIMQDEETVLLHPDQIEFVIKWLREAAQEATAKTDAAELAKIG